MMVPALRITTLLVAVSCCGTGHAAGAGKTFGPNGALYCANKAALDAFSAVELYRTINGMQDLGVPPPGCGTIQPGEAGVVSDVTRDGMRIAGMIVLAKFAGGMPVHFVALEKAPPEAAPTAPAVAAPPPVKRVFKVVGPEDVRNTPKKWEGRDIRFERVRVYWVADDDVRFLTRANLTLFGEDVRGDARTIAFLKENCETSREADMAKCVVSVNFRYTRHGEDNPGGLMKRTVLATDDIEVERPAQRRR